MRSAELAQGFKGTLKELHAQSYYDLAVGTFVFMGPFLHKKY